MGSGVKRSDSSYTYVYIDDIVRIEFFILYKHDFNFGKIDCTCPVLPMIQVTLND